MGGMGSGRSGGRPTVESALSIDIGQMFRLGIFRRGGDRNCCWKWTDDYTGATAAEVVMCTRLSDEEDPHVRLIHRESQATTADYRIDLKSSVQPYGGVRWWFICPITGMRVAKLRLPRGAIQFASRQAYCLGYYTQRASPRDRAIRRMHKMRKRLNLGPGLQGEFEKPSRMRWETFDREVAKLNAMEARAYAYAAPAIQKLRQKYAL